MSKIVWDAVGEKTFETGCDRGVVYPIAADGTYPKGYGWNGLTNVSESPSGGESNKLYADNSVYANLTSAEEFGATVEAYTYPDEFAECDGSKEIAEGVTIGQQNRKAFGFCYRTLIGNDTEGQEHGYKIHCVYNAKVNPSERSYPTTNDSPDATQLSWELSTTPIHVTGYKDTALVVIDSTKVDSTKLETFEAILYGTDGEGSATGTDPRLPLPDEIAQHFA